MNKKPSAAPASGEVNAITGYSNQYEYAACLIYRRMMDGTLDGIIVADKAAGIFDDVVLRTYNGIQATQVKSQRHAKYVSLNTELITSELAKEITASWRCLEEKYGEGKIRLRYIFPGLFSRDDILLANEGTSGARHSAAFADFVSREGLTQDDIDSSIWSEKLAELRRQTGLSSDAFLRFVQNLELLSERELNRQQIQNLPPQEQKQIEAIRDLIPQLVKESDKQQDWSEKELVDRLGWVTRPNQTKLHDFPVPGDFQENATTEIDLADAVCNHTRGYVALVGPPGTGKSTLLQRALFSTTEYSVSRYLAFLPGERGQIGRAEAGDFLNDLIQELRSQGFIGSRLRSDNLTGLRNELMKQLQTASESYKATGRKAVIVIDGLDHVPREETPHESFLKELPSPDTIPEGVIFVLGTQSLDLADLKPAIVQQAKKADRNIPIQPLPREAIFQMAKVAGLSDFVDREALYAACKGHPLTARYFIEHLKDAPNAETARITLSLENGLGESLEQIYERVWQKLNTNDAARDALGILARVEGNLAASQLAQATSDQAVEDVLRDANFLLMRTTDGRLSIFHNSFRLFVAARTALKFGMYSEDMEKSFHKRLASVAARAAADDPQKWMELRYTSRADDAAEVRRLAAPEYFRRSLAAFRPASEIYIDLRISYAAIKPTRDRVLLLRLLLIEKEIDYRLEAVSQIDFVELFLELDRVDLATRHALEIGSSGNGWLFLVDELWEEGQASLARQVFEANEPLETLFGQRGLSPNQEINDAYDWIQRAHRFRSKEKLLALINSIPIDSTFRHDAEESVRMALRYRLGLGIVRDGKSTDIPALASELGLVPPHSVMLRVEEALLEPVAETAIEKLGDITNIPEFGDLHQSWRRAVAVRAQKLGAHEIARKIALTLSVPLLDGDRGNIERDSLEDRSQAIFESTVLGDLLGVAIPSEAANNQLETSAILAAMDQKVRELGSLRAQVERSENLVSVLSDLKAVILFFANAAPDRSDFEGYRFHGALGWFAKTLFRIASRLDTTSRNELISLVEATIAQGDNNLARSQSFRLRFSAFMFDQDADAERAKQRIEAALLNERTDRTPQDAVSFRIEFAKAFHYAGMSSEVQSSLEALHQDTFGYWLRAKKEPQYIFWAWSYLKACESAPQRVSVTATEFGRFILGMDQTDGDETAMRLVGDLLSGAGSSPQVTAALFLRLKESDLTSWAELADCTLAAIAQHDPDSAGITLTAYSQLVIPFYSPDRAKTLALAFATLPAKERAATAAMLVEAANRWCPPSVRASLLETVFTVVPEAKAAFAADFGAAQSCASEISETTQSGGSSENGGVSLDIDADSLTQLLEKGDGVVDYGTGVDYSYGRAAERLAETATMAEMEAFLSARPHLYKDAKAVAAFSNRAWDLGHKAEADTLFAAAEAAAHGGHWSSFMGGEKKAVQKLRIKFAGDLGKEQGFDVLVDELSSGQTFGPSLFLNLDEVLEQISPNPPYERFWGETEQHLQQYREYRLVPPVIPSEGVSSHTALLALVVASAFSFSCPTILDRGREAALRAARDDKTGEFVKNLFVFLHQRTDGPREVATLMHRMTESAHLRMTLAAEAKQLISHEDFVVSTLAEKTLIDLDEDFEAPPVANLPAFYSIASSNSDQSTDFDAPPGLTIGNRPVWVDDPWTWTWFLKFPLSVMSDASGISVEMLRRRAAEFMRREGGKAAFGPEVDKAIEARLRRMALQFTFNRAMPGSAHRSVGKVLQELASADAIDPNAFPIVWADIGGPTLRDIRLSVVPKPDWVALPSIPEREYGRLNREAWLEQTEDCVHIPWPQGEIVLAEERIYKLRAWRDSAESHRLVLPEDLQIADGIEKVPRLFSLDDRRPLYSETESRLVARFAEDLFGDLRESTLTICPYVATRLGWRRQQLNPFVLVDSAGEIVAQTVRWVDGTDRYSSYDVEVYAQGQALVLTQTGHQQLESRYGAIRCQVSAIRCAQGEGRQSDSRSLVSGPSSTFLGG